MTKTAKAALVLLFGMATGALHAQGSLSQSSSDPAPAPQTVDNSVSSYWYGGTGPGPGCHCEEKICCDKLCEFFSYRRKCCPCKCWGHCCHGCFPRPYLFFMRRCYSGIGGPYPPCCANGGCKHGCSSCCGSGGIVGMTDGAGGCATCGH